MTHYIKNEAGLLVPFAPHLIKRAFVEAEVSNRATMQGLYKLTVRRGDGSIKQETPWFENLILDAGLDHLGTNGAATNGAATGMCEIGTGASAPDSSQTQLQSFSARTFNCIANNSYAQPTSPYFYSSWGTWRFAIGALNGNYTEVGIGWLANNLFSRALITPDGVTPSAITVLADEQLDVSYTVRVYPPSETDWQAASFSISGSSYDVLGRLCSAATHHGAGPLLNNDGVLPFSAGANAVQAAAGGIGAITSVPGGASSIGTARNHGSYTPGSLQRTATAGFALGEGNVGGVRCVVLTPNGLGYTCQYQFTPAIPKDATKTLSLVFNCSWARRP